MLTSQKQSPEQQLVVNTPSPVAPSPLAKLLLEIGPLVLFFITNAYAQKWLGIAGDQRIFVATAVFMTAIVISISLHYVLYRHLPLMAIISCAVVLVFGGLTIWLQDDLFIKLKPTIVNGLFGSILLIGLMFKRSLLSHVLDSVFHLTAQGWRILSLRWGLFFLFLAALNEIIWRQFSTDFWVSFKVFGIMPITIVFAMLQISVITKHDLANETSNHNPSDVH